MNKKLLIILGTTIAAIGFLVLIFIIFWNTNTQSPTRGEQGIRTSTGVTFPTPGAGNNPVDTIPITIENGESLQIKDFIHDPETAEDSVNAGYYHLGRHFIDGVGENIPYTIDYIDTTDFFNIVLYQEPIAASRKAAEQYLMLHLGISQSQMCELIYTVSVPHTVSEFYTSQDLRFSFCPGSVSIPE
jgi:hypothetical protein